MNEVNYTVRVFEGNAASLVQDPTDENNTVIQSTKTNGASGSAGTTIGTAAGFATDIPLTLNDTEMTVRVWSPTAGTPIRLKVENASNNQETCETEAVTTVAGAWETLTFNFANEAAGTATLANGITNGWVFNMASIFFNFGTDGATAGAQTYYFDDVMFGQPVVTLAQIDVSPNPSYDTWRLHSSQDIITKVEVLNMSGLLIDTYTNDDYSLALKSDDYVSGMYIAKITTERGVGVVRLVRY